MKKLHHYTYAFLIAVGLTQLAPANAQAAELMGASINTERKEILTVVDEHDAVVVLGTAKDGFRTSENARAASRLLIVDAYGRVSQARHSFTDRNGVSIEMSRDGLDKIVILNARREIVGGSGLSSHEIDEVTHAHDLRDVEDMLSLVDSRNQDAILNAAKSAEQSAHSASEKREMTADYLRMFGRDRSADELATALDRAQPRADVAMASSVSAMFAATDSNNKIIVADWVSTEAGNGGGSGPGYVATEAGNGGGSGPGYVATEAGNGGGSGPGIVSQWQSESMSLSIPNMQQVDAHTAGTFLLISHYF